MLCTFSGYTFSLPDCVAGVGVRQQSGLYNNPALIQDRIKAFEGLHFEKAEYLSSLITAISKDTSGLVLK